MMEWGVHVPAAAEVHLTYVDLNQPHAVVKTLEQTLAPEEWARVGRMRFAEDARRFVVRRGLLRHLLGSLTGAAPDEITFALGPQGKPRLASPYDQSGVHFNLSDSGELAILAWTIGVEIGVDVEQIRPLRDAEALACRHFAPTELAWFRQQPASMRMAAFFRCWTCKEAVVKALGDGLTIPLQNFVAAHWGEPPTVHWATAGETTPGAHAAPLVTNLWTLSLPQTPTGYVGAVAVPLGEVSIHTHQIANAASWRSASAPPSSNKA